MRVIGRIAAVILAVGAACAAQQPNGSPVGRWTGQSLCTVKPSACHDEQVVYKISAPGSKQDVLVIKADKIVNGERQWMGDLQCSYAAGALTCPLDNKKGVWTFDVSGDVMTGMLKLSDGTLFRKVSVRRAK